MFVVGFEGKLEHPASCGSVAVTDGSGRYWNAVLKVEGRVKETCSRAELEDYARKGALTLFAEKHLVMPSTTPVYAISLSRDMLAFLAAGEDRLSRESACAFWEKKNFVAVYQSTAYARTMAESVARYFWERSESEPKLTRSLAYQLEWAATLLWPELMLTDEYRSKRS